MNIAIPLFGKRVSPRFDFCQEMLILTVEGGTVLNQKTVSISSLTPFQRIAELYHRDVDTVICGGINGFAHRHLTSHGISVIDNVMGEANEALNRYLAGQLKPSAFCKVPRSRVCGKGKNALWRFLPVGIRTLDSEKEDVKK